MKEMKDIYFVVMRVIALIFGIIACITIIGAIIGIPLIIGSNKFGEAVKMSDEQLVQNRGAILGWGIFMAIVLAPTFIGLILILICACLVDSYIKNIAEGNSAKNEKSFKETIVEGSNNAIRGIKSTFSAPSDLDKQKSELQKLEKMKEDGIITSEEYETLRKKILGL